MKVLSTKRLRLIITVIAATAVLISTTAIISFAYDNANRVITVQTNNVINDRFYGVGFNVMPLSLMQNNRSKGYNEAYWELEKNRILRMQPRLVRVWFQLDWMLTDNDLLPDATGEDYFNGTYNFESEKMKALYYYLDAFKQVNAKVIICQFGTALVSDWWNIDGIYSSSSGPGNINAYAEAMSSLFEYLIKNKGYTNVNYISLANEPNLAGFVAHGDRIAYYMAMGEAVMNAIDSKSLPVDLFGIEASQTTISSGSWMYKALQSDSQHDFIDCYGFHFYIYNSTKNKLENFITSLKSFGVTKPMFMSEYAAPEGAYGFDSSLSSSVITAANYGIDGAIQWILNDIYFEEGRGDLDDTKAGGNTGFFYKPQENPIPKDCYYETCLHMRYINSDSQVITATASKNDDMYTTAFKSGEDYTVLVETEVSNVNNITIQFDKSINKTFYRHIYAQDTTKRDSNALIPVSSAALSASDSFKDSDMSGINDERCCIVYTTINDARQVEIDNPVSTVAPGGVLQLNATPIGSSSHITWSVAFGSGSITTDGLYTASDTVSGDTVALKAGISGCDDYGIAIVKIK